jgi:lysophospholipase L1-like esterase
MSYTVRAMKIAALIFALSLAAHAQYMQAIASKSADNCDVRADKMEKWLLDWANLARYRQADLDAASAPVARRVVFMGDSITDHWDIAASFPTRPYVNRGISGQTTAQMLLRFQNDVVNAHAAAVVILAGTNDIAGNTGPMTLEEIENNFAAMAAIARAHNIPVIVSSILPVHNYTERAEMFFPSRSMDKIRALNVWLKDFAARNHYPYVDYFSAMLDEHGLLKCELADDGLHPNAAGYALMVKMLKPTIESVLPPPSNSTTRKGN